MANLAYKTRHFFGFSIFVIVVLILNGCSPAALGIQEDTETPTATLVTVPGATSAPVVTLKISKNADLGSYLTDESGFTLYYYKDDTARIRAAIAQILNQKRGRIL